MQENPGFAGFVTDDDYSVRFAMNFTPDGEQLCSRSRRSQGKTGAELPSGKSSCRSARRRDDHHPGRLRQDRPDAVPDRQPRAQHGGAVLPSTSQTGKTTLIAEDPRADVGGVLAHPTEKTIQAVSFTYARTRVEDSRRSDPAPTSTTWRRSPTARSRHQPHARRQAVDRGLLLDDGPVQFYLYDRAAKKAHFLFTNRDDLDEYALVKMHRRSSRPATGWSWSAT